MDIIRTYICGPISGYDFSERFARFEQEEERIFRRGEIPVNPMKNGLDAGDSWHRHLDVDIGLIRTCQKMVVLPYYENSRGCQEEIELASLIDGMEIEYLSRINEKKPEKTEYNPFDALCASEE